EDCTFDQCIAFQSDDEYIKKKWLSLSERVVHQIEEEVDNTGGGTCQAGYEKVGIQCFYFGTDKNDEEDLTWEEAFNYCQEMGGRLAVIKEFEIFQKYQKDNYEGSSLWVGVSDIEREGKFRWINGEILQEGFPWHHNQPDNWFNEDCVHSPSDFNYEYNDLKCTDKKQFVCDDTKGELTLPGEATFTTKSRLQNEPIKWFVRICHFIIFCNNDERNGDYILFITEDNYGKETLVYIEEEKITSEPLTFKLCDLLEGAYDLGNGRSGLIYLLPNQRDLPDLDLFRIWNERDKILDDASLSKNDIEETTLSLSKKWMGVKC
ncbi:unnamed protein product, partial [Meganyctiphanes norvegica]